MIVGGKVTMSSRVVRLLQKNGAKVFVYAVLSAYCLQTIYPILWMILGSLKNPIDLLVNPWGLPREWMWQNYADAWRIGKLGVHIGNSVITTVSSVVLLLSVSTLAAYALARLEFPGKTLVFYLVLGSMIIPPQASCIPLFMLVLRLGLLKTRLGLILVYATLGTGFSTFIMRGFFLSIPKELEEAAIVDGATRFQSFLRIVLPLARPGWATVTIFYGMSFWNEFFLAYLLARVPELQTIPMGLVVFFHEVKTEWTLYLAALTTVSLPVILLFVIMQRQFIEGLSAGALKG